MGKPVDYSIFMEVWEKEYTLTRQLYRNCLKWSNKVAVYDPFRQVDLTYQDLYEESNQFAHALLDLGLTTYDAIVGDIFNTYEWFTVFMGCAKARMKFHTLNTRLPEGQVSILMDDCEATVLVYDSELKDMILKALQRVKVKPKACVMVGPGDVPEGHVSYEEFIKGKPKTPPVTEKDVAWLDPVLGLYTSGTTGLPKGFYLNHACIFFDNMMNSALLKMDDRSVCLVTNPLYHRGGSTTGPIPCLHQGGSVVLMRHFDENLALDYIEKYKVTHMVAPPVIYERMCDAQDAKPRDLSSLSAVVSMGAPLERETCLRFMNTLCPNVYNGYGTADMHWVTMLKPWELPEKAGTIGRAIAEDIVKVVRMDLGRRADPNNPEDECPKDGKTEGEIAIRTMHGSDYHYINRPKDEEKSFPYRGWQFPGDVAVWDEEGYITIRGRIDDMIISGGVNIHPALVEEVLKEHPGVIDAMVVGVPSKKWGETVVAYVALKDPSVTEKDLDEFCKNHPMLARFQRPRYYKFVDLKDLPFTPSGKKAHYLLRRRAKEDFKDIVE